MKSRVQANKKEYPLLRSLNALYSILLAGLIVVLIFTVWFSSVRISDGGMAPVFQEGDVILFDKLAKHLSMPERGDAYAFRLNEGTSVGRIVALPGDRVQLYEGRVYVNGYLLDESRYARECAWEMDEVTLPEGCFFLMPDERTAQNPDFESMVIPFEALIGRAALRVAPFGMINVFVA